MRMALPIQYLMMKSPWWGAQTQLHCALAPFDQLEAGSYYSDCVVKKEVFVTGDDKYAQEASKLWDISEKIVKDFV